MKKSSLLILSVIFLLQCSSAVKKGEPGRGFQKKGSPPVKAEDSINKSWSLYSYGLLYKNIARQSKSFPEMQKNMNRAIDYFKRSEAEKTALDRVYIQLADCYYYIFDFKSSLEYADKAIALKPDSMEPYNRKFNIYMKLRNYKKAADVLSGYLEMDPDSVRIRYILAEHYLKRLKNSEAALKEFLMIEELYLTKGLGGEYLENTYYNIGFINFEKNRSGAALQYFNKAYSANPDRLNTIRILASLNMTLLRLPEAEKFALLYLERVPGSKYMHSVLGRIYYIQQRPDALHHLRKSAGSKTVEGLISSGLYFELLRDDERAGKILRMVVMHKPDAVTPHIALARISLREGDKKAAFNEYLTAGVLLYKKGLRSIAKRNFMEALGLRDDVPGLYYYLGRINEDDERLSAAILYYKKAHALKPDSDMLLHIGYLYALNEQYGEAMKYFKMVSLKEPKNSKPYFFRGLVSIWREDYPRAEHDIKKAILLEKTSETYYFYLAIALEKMNRLDEAIESLENAIKYNPKSARVYNYLGYLYADNNMKIDESYDLIRKALEIEPENGAYVDSLGWVYFRRGNYRKALENLLRAERLLSESENPDPVVYDHIGDTYHKLGQTDRAIMYWKKSMDMEKNSEILKKIKKKIQLNTRP